MRIGEIAKRAGVGVETVRFYESRGLIAQPPRPAGGGYRDYPDELVHRIQFVRGAQRLGFSLREIDELLVLESGPQPRCDNVREHAGRKLAEVEARIAGLERIRAALVALIDACPGKGPTRDCSILNELRSGDRPRD